MVLRRAGVRERREPLKCQRYDIFYSQRFKIQFQVKKLSSKEGKIKPNKKVQDFETEVFQQDSIACRSITTEPLDVRKLMEELKIPEKPTKYDEVTDDSDEDIKPVVMKAVKVWRARKKEESKLKKRYETLMQNYKFSKTPSLIQNSNFKAAKVKPLSK